MGQLFSVVVCVLRIAAYILGLAAVLAFMTVSPELKLNKITDDEVKNKTPDRFVNHERKKNLEKVFYLFCFFMNLVSGFLK